jgi:S1-C subfamily serine protease
VTARRAAAVCVPLLLAAAAIGNATGGDPAGGPSVVTIEARGERTATGFVVSDERVVTVAHALGTGRVRVRGPDGIERRATVLRRDRALDLALLFVPDLPAAPQSLSRGAPHVLLRRDGGRVATRAVVRRRLDARVRAADGRLIARRPALELIAPIRAGDSGAPLIGADGRVAGIVFARSRDRAGLAYAVDASALTRLLR